MPKMKTNASAKKRFSVTGTGKIKRKHAKHNFTLSLLIIAEIKFIFYLKDLRLEKQKPKA